MRRSRGRGWDCRRAQGLSVGLPCLVSPVFFLIVRRKGEIICKLAGEVYRLFSVGCGEFSGKAVARCADHLWSGVPCGPESCWEWGGSAVSFSDVAALPKMAHAAFPAIPAMIASISHCFAFNNCLNGGQSLMASILFPHHLKRSAHRSSTMVVMAEAATTCLANHRCNLRALPIMLRSVPR